MCERACVSIYVSVREYVQVCVCVCVCVCVVCEYICDVRERESVQVVCELC